MVSLLGRNAIRNQGRSMDSVTYGLRLLIKSIGSHSECQVSRYWHEIPGLHTFPPQKVTQGTQFLQVTSICPPHWLGLLRTLYHLNFDQKVLKNERHLFCTPDPLPPLAQNSVQALFWFGFYLSYQMPSPYQRTSSLSMPIALFQEEHLF